MSARMLPKVVHQASSPFGTLLVVDEGDERSLRFEVPDGPRQSAILKSDPTAVPVGYVRAAAAGLALTEGRSRALVVGLGGGTLPLLLRRSLPSMTVDVVEVNPGVVEVARRFFGVHEDGRLRIHVEDGADFMGRSGPRYDFLLLDAFAEEGTPDHLKSPAFFADVRARLAPGGVALLNIALVTDAEKARLLDTFAGTFAHAARLLGPGESANVLGVGSMEPLPDEAHFRRRLHRLERQLGVRRLARSVVSFRHLTPRHPSGPGGR